MELARKASEELVRALRDRIVAVALFGSQARAEASATSTSSWS